MSEDDMNLKYSEEETGTSGEQVDSQQNNTSNASEGASTQKTGRTAQDRIQQLIKERDEWKAKATGTADKSSPASQEVPEDKLWRAKVEAKLSAPEYLKDKADEIATYQAKYGVPIEDAIALFDSKGKVSQADLEAANAAKAEAAQSRTGGTANPAARSDAPDVGKLSNDELEAQLKQAIASGEKI